MTEMAREIRERIAELPEGFYRECGPLLHRAAVKIEQQHKALKAVEDWWLSDGMKTFTGAPYAIFAVRAALSIGSDQTATTNRQYVLQEAWSVRARPDGSVEPGERISAVGIGYEFSNDVARASERYWLEHFERINPGAPYFRVEAEFQLVEAAQPLSSGHGTEPSRSPSNEREGGP